MLDNDRTMVDLSRMLQAVSLTTFGIDTDMSLQAEMPLIAFFGLVHLGVTLLTLVLGGAGGLDDGGIDQRALRHHDAGLREPLVDGIEELARQLVRAFSSVAPAIPGASQRPRAAVVKTFTTQFVVPGVERA